MLLAQRLIQKFLVISMFLTALLWSTCIAYAQTVPTAPIMQPESFDSVNENAQNLEVSRVKNNIEHIETFLTEIEILKDSSIAVTETIEYDFTSLKRHGIFRTIPIKYNARGGNFSLRINDISVTDESGHNRPFATTQQGRNKEIKIGDPNKYVSGKQTYVISYTIKRAINQTNIHDELYWNSTGIDWTVPISNATTVVTLPDNTKATDVFCYQGPFGNSTPCKSAIEKNGIATFSATTIGNGSGLTVVVGVPKGILTFPSAWQEFLYIFSDNWVLLIAPATLIFCVFYWYIKGRDPSGKKTIIPQYEPPENLTPSEIGTIVDENVSNKDISAMIIHLAVRGYIKIDRIEKKWLLGKDDYQLSQLKDEVYLSNDFERRFMNTLFKVRPNALKKLTSQAMKVFFGNEKSTASDVKNILQPGSAKQPLATVQISDLEDTFYTDLKEVRSLLYKAVTQKRYFPKNPQTVRGAFGGTGIAVIIFGFIFAPALLGTYATFSFVGSGIILLIFALAMPVKTRRGVLAKEHILGLKMYLNVAEKDRLKFHHAPKKDPQTFEKLLPYAMVLGVEKQWAKQFENIYASQPSWYHDPSSNTFSAIALTNAMTKFNSVSQTTLASAPNSASGGGSGMSGGGFSGGGFGGGGGGSW